MADQNKETKLRSLFSELRKLIEKQSYAKAVKVCNKIIAQTGDVEEKAWYCKISAQIHLGQFKDALKTLSNSKFIDNLIFEKAYCEYRLNETLEAWETISKAPADSPPRIKELQAQILYRLERFDDCFDIYRELIKNTSDQFDQERLTNLSAVFVNRIYEGLQEQGPKPTANASYEHLYNSACELLALGRISEALELLQKSENVCRHVLATEEEATEEEINEEIAIIRVQQGHCLQLLNREKEAGVLLFQVQKTRPDDEALATILANNIAVVDRGNTEAKKRVRVAATAAPSSVLAHKLTSRQKIILTRNNCILGYYTNQDDLTETECASLTSDDSDAVLATMLRAAQVGRSGEASDAAEMLQRFAEEKPEHKTEAALAAVQIYLSKKEIDPAVDLLLSLEEPLRFSKGVISAIAVLCAANKKPEIASKVFADAIQWHQQNKSPSSVIDELCYNGAKFEQRSKNAKGTASLLKELRKLRPKDKNILVQLLAAYIQFDHNAASALSKELPSAGGLVSHVDAASLDTAFSVAGGGGKYSSGALGSPKANKGKGPLSEAEVKERRRQKKKRRQKTMVRQRYGKSMRSNQDRWLPRWQRRSNQRKGGHNVRGSQGTSGREADKFDITKNEKISKKKTTQPQPQPSPKDGSQSQSSTAAPAGAGPKLPSGIKSTILKKKGRKNVKQKF